MSRHTVVAGLTPQSLPPTFSKGKSNQTPQSQRVVKLGPSAVPTLPPPNSITNDYSHNGGTIASTVLLQQQQKIASIASGNTYSSALQISHTADAANDNSRLKRRIQDLERDNEKLRRHVAQAEEHIRMTRGFLSSRTESPPCHKMDAQSQTDANISIISGTDKIIETRRNSLFSGGTSSIYTPSTDVNGIASRDDKIKSMNTQLNELRAENAKLNNLHKVSTSSIADLEKKNNELESKEKDANKRVESLLLKVAELDMLLKEKNCVSLALENRIKQLEMERSESLQANSPNQTQAEAQAQEEVNNCDNQTQTSDVTSPSRDDQKMLRQLQQSQIFEDRIRCAVRNCWKMISVEKDNLAKDKAEIQALLGSFMTEFGVGGVVQNKLLHHITESLGALTCDLKASKEREESVIADRMRLQMELERLKSLTPESLATSSPSPTANPSEEGGISTVFKGSENLQGPTTISNNNSESDLSDKLSLALETGRVQQQKAEEFFVRLQTAANTLCKLQESHSKQLKAAQKEAHVKDLGRIATLRELSIEKDSLINELKYTNDICNVLSFSLNTAEQALTETQPQVVAKLVEGRTKRLKAIEKQSNERKKDIDQRSAETCAVSSSHLEAFKVKAIEASRLASIDTAAAIQDLQTALRADGVIIQNYESEGGKSQGKKK